MLTPVLVAMVNIRVEQYTLDHMTKVAKHKSGIAIAASLVSFHALFISVDIWVRMQSLTRKSITYKYFHIFKSNALRGASSLSSANDIMSPTSTSGGMSGNLQSEKNLKNEVHEADATDGVYINFWERELLKREDYSLFIFSKDGIVRKYCSVVLRSKFFNAVLVGGICLANISILRPLIEEGSAYDILSQAIIMSIFITEVILKWISMGVFTYSNGEGYFWYVLNCVDFSVCFLVVVALSTGSRSLRAVYIFRLTKFPSLFSCK